MKKMLTTLMGIAIITGGTAPAYADPYDAGPFVVQWKQAAADLDGDGRPDILVANLLKKGDRVALVGFNGISDRNNENGKGPGAGLPQYNKAELIDAIASTANISKADAKRALDGFLQDNNDCDDDDADVHPSQCSRGIEKHQIKRGMVTAKLNLSVRTADQIAERADRCRLEECALVASHADYVKNMVTGAASLFHSGNDDAAHEVAHTIQQAYHIVRRDVDVLSELPRKHASSLLALERSLLRHIEDIIDALDADDDGDGVPTE